MGAISGELERDTRVRALMAHLHLYLMATAPPTLKTKSSAVFSSRSQDPQGQEELVNLAEKLIEQGRTEGRAEGLRDAIEATLSTRGLSLSERGRARLHACTRVETLTRWLTRAVTAASEVDVFDSESGT
jgi:hypothetical protein